jgi:hypothetical protein
MDNNLYVFHRAQIGFEAHPNYYPTTTKGKGGGVKQSKFKSDHISLPR